MLLLVAAVLLSALFGYIQSSIKTRCCPSSAQQLNICLNVLKKETSPCSAEHWSICQVLSTSISCRLLSEYRLIWVAVSPRSLCAGEMNSCHLSTSHSRSGAGGWACIAEARWGDIRGDVQCRRWLASASWAPDRDPARRWIYLRRAGGAGGCSRSCLLGLAPWLSPPAPCWERGCAAERGGHGHHQNTCI